MAGLFKDSFTEKSQSKRHFNTSQAPSREIPNKGQFETPREGDKQTFTTDPLEPLIDPPQDPQDPPSNHEMMEQPQQHNPALVAVINAMVQAAMTF